MHDDPSSFVVEVVGAANKSDKSSAPPEPLRLNRVRTGQCWSLARAATFYSGSARQGLVLRQGCREVRGRACPESPLRTLPKERAPQEGTAGLRG